MASLIPGNLHTTAMGILPHDQVDPALELALSVDIPFWPQLPHVSYYEDMYVQAGEHFPGMVLLPEKNSLRFDTNKFYEELPELLDRWSDLDYFDISPAYSAVYHRFLELDLSGYVAIRGQMEGPVSFGLKVLDENDRPIIFNDEVRPLLMDFLARRVQAQLTRLKEKHPKAFMFVDEPGLQFVFSSVSGYTDITAKEDLDRFFSQIEPPRGIHLCGNPDWEFLLNRDIDILSMDIFTNGEILKAYGQAFQTLPGAGRGHRLGHDPHLVRGRGRGQYRPADGIPGGPLGRPGPGRHRPGPCSWPRASLPRPAAAWSTRTATRP